MADITIGQPRSNMPWRTKLSELIRLEQTKELRQALLEAYRIGKISPKSLEIMREVMPYVNRRLYEALLDRQQKQVRAKPLLLVLDAEGNLVVNRDNATNFVDEFTLKIPSCGNRTLWDLFHAMLFEENES
jgi:hypothetical protein